MKAVTSHRTPKQPAPMTTHTIELPPRLTQPLSRETPPLGRFVQRFPELFEDDDVFCAIKTRTSVDVGHWVFRARVWAIATPEHLLVIATGKQPLAMRIAYSQLANSTYNHVTGCLTLAPNVDSRIQNLKVSPVDGYQLLAQIYSV